VLGGNKRDERLKTVPVIIFFYLCPAEHHQTAFYTCGQHYIRKPASFTDLTELIHKAIQGMAETTTAENG
jgi:hypothetical protein